MRELRAKLSPRGVCQGDSIMQREQELTASHPTAGFPVSSVRLDPARQAESRLRDSSYVGLRKVRCDFHEGVLTLRGRVPSFYTKQLAQSLAACVPGVEEVVNRIEVQEVTTC
jgi:osmotically-inducible protein OsmY